MLTRRYLPILALAVFVPPEASAAEHVERFRVTTISAVRASPNGRIVDIWNEGIRVAADRVKGDWVRVQKRFDAGDWNRLPSPRWISRHYVAPLVEPPAGPVERYALVNKSSFRLKVMERRGKRERVLYETKVALGLDGCLPEEKGGRCYYTEPGEYKVRWKVHDPEGIEWCIPESMEEEYAEDIAAGKRCFRGVIGTHALNIGKSYAIHGTHKPETLGTRSTHGCVRVANGPMQAIYDYLDVGDQVLITD